MTIFDDLDLEYDTLTYYAAYVSVQDAMKGIRSDLYASSQSKRMLIYISMLRQVSLAMLDDGGPTLGRRLIEESLAEMVAEERRRGSRAFGPFLTSKQLQCLQQDREPEGLGWPVTFTEDDKTALE